MFILSDYSFQLPIVIEIFCVNASVAAIGGFYDLILSKFVVDHGRGIRLSTHLEKRGNTEYNVRSYFWLIIVTQNATIGAFRIFRRITFVFQLQNNRFVTVSVLKKYRSRSDTSLQYNTMEFWNIRVKYDETLIAYQVQS